MPALGDSRIKPPHPPHPLPDLSSHPDHAYKRAMFVPSVARPCHPKMQMEVKLQGKPMSWIVLLLVTQHHPHQPQQEQDGGPRRILTSQGLSECYLLPPPRKTVLMKMAQLRNVQSALWSMMWGIIWQGWNVFASFIRRALWNGLIGSLNVQCTR